MLIDINKVTEKQKLLIRNGLNTYIFIMKNKNKIDDDYKEVFGDFYFSSQPAMKRSENIDKYFEIMKNCDGKENVAELVIRLKHELPINKYEFSFTTKLIHTINDSLPIYDSIVRNYLIKNYGLNFKFNNNQSKNEEIKRKCIKDDWNLLIKWYNDFLKTELSKEWIKWFDNEFPDSGKNISNIKKIDFIIYACSPKENW